MNSQLTLTWRLLFLLPFLALAWVPKAETRQGEPAPPAFPAKTVTRTGLVQLPRLADSVFPLFGPIREKEWAEGWEPQVIPAEDDIPREGMVFTTKHPGEEDTVWVLTRLEPARHEITYVTVTPGSRVGMIHISCQDAESGGSRAQVTYTFTALGPSGNTYIREFTEKSYGQRMAAWEHAFRYYLETGRRFHHHE